MADFGNFHFVGSQEKERCLLKQALSGRFGGNGQIDVANNK